VPEERDARGEALKDQYVSTEHVLLGLLEGKALSAEVLKRHGVTRDAVLNGACARSAATSGSTTRTPRTATRRSSATAATSPSSRARASSTP
jgi:hypothetical protein